MSTCVPQLYHIYTQAPSLQGFLELPVATSTFLTHMNIYLVNGKRGPEGHQDFCRAVAIGMLEKK